MSNTQKCQTYIFNDVVNKITLQTAIGLKLVKKTEQELAKDRGWEREKRKYNNMYESC